MNHFLVGFIFICFFLYRIDTGKVAKCFSCKGKCEDPPTVEYCPDRYNYSCVIVTAIGTQRSWIGQFDADYSKLNNTSAVEYFEYRGCRKDIPSNRDLCLHIDHDDGCSCFMCDQDLCNWELDNY